MNSTIFSNSGQRVQELLVNNSSEKVLIVPIDFAKSKHLAKICDGSGKYIHRRPMVLHNNKKGCAYLIDRIEKSCSRRHVKKSSVIIASEDPHSYAKPFLQRLKDLGYLVVQVNAHKAKTLRSSGMASSDELDLDGIANAVLNRHAVELKGQEATYTALQIASRSFHADVKQTSRTKNQITKLMDQLLPGFLSKKESGLESFGKVSIALMKRGITVRKLKSMPKKSIIKTLQTFHIKNIQSTLDKLEKLGNDNFMLDSDLESSLVELLKIKVKLLENLQQTTQDTLKMCKVLLLKTPYCLTMSIPGIAEIRAVTLAGEFGTPGNLPQSKSMCAYAGVVPRTTQTGGPDKGPVVIGLPQKANRRLKNAILSASFDQGNYAHPAGRLLPQYGRHRLQEHFIKVHSEGRRSGISTAKLMIKIVRRMVKDNSLYLPQKERFDKQELAIYIETSITTIYNYFGADMFYSIPENENILLQTGREWQNTMKGFYDIELNLPF